MDAGSLKTREAQLRLGWLIKLPRYSSVISTLRLLGLYTNSLYSRAWIRGPLGSMQIAHE